MTGKLTSKGRQTRQRIVAAAAGLMFEGGVARTTMEDVRAAGGLLLTQIRRSTEPLDTVLAHVALLLVPAAD